jgi:hypothetical protein
MPRKNRDKKKSELLDPKDMEDGGAGTPKAGEEEAKMEQTADDIKKEIAEAEAEAQEQATIDAEDNAEDNTKTAQEIKQIEKEDDKLIADVDDLLKKDEEILNEPPAQVEVVTTTIVEETTVDKSGNLEVSEVKTVTTEYVDVNASTAFTQSVFVPPTKPEEVHHQHHNIPEDLTSSEYVHISKTVVEETKIEESVKSKANDTDILEKSDLASSVGSFTHTSPRADNKTSVNTSSPAVFIEKEETKIFVESPPVHEHHSNLAASVFEKIPAREEIKTKFVEEVIEKHHHEPEFASKKVAEPVMFVEKKVEPIITVNKVEPIVVPANEKGKIVEDMKSPVVDELIVSKEKIKDKDGKVYEVKEVIRVEEVKNSAVKKTEKVAVIEEPKPVVEQKKTDKPTGENKKKTEKSSSVGAVIGGGISFGAVGYLVSKYLIKVPSQKSLIITAVSAVAGALLMKANTK